MTSAHRLSSEASPLFFFVRIPSFIYARKKFLCKRFFWQDKSTLCVYSIILWLNTFPWFFSKYVTFYDIIIFWGQKIKTSFKISCFLEEKKFIFSFSFAFCTVSCAFCFLFRFNYLFAHLYPFFGDIVNTDKRRKNELRELFDVNPISKIILFNSFLPSIRQTSWSRDILH